jgi:hypothetical protein
MSSKVIFLNFGSAAAANRQEAMKMKKDRIVFIGNWVAVCLRETK